MKITKILFIAFAFIATAVSSCKKDGGDLTKDIVGTYTNTPDEIEVTVSKVDDKHVAILYDNDGTHTNYAFKNVTMDSKTTFTLDTSVDKSYGYYTTTRTGTGVCTSNSISLFVTYKKVPTAIGLSNGYSESNGDSNISATR